MAVLCRSGPRSVLVKYNSNDCSGRMQLAGQVCAITQHRHSPGSAPLGIRPQLLTTPNFHPFLTKAIDHADESAFTFSARYGPAAASRQPQNRDSFVCSPMIHRANQELVNFAATPEMSHGDTVPTSWPTHRPGRGKGRRGRWLRPQLH